MKSPQQQIFDLVFSISEQLGYKTFDYLPAEKVGYPFVFIGEQYDSDIRNKSVIHGQVNQSVHIYHDYRKRTELSLMIDNIRYEIRKAYRTESFSIDCRGIDSRILIDDSDARVLNHGLMEIDFVFN